MDILLFYRTISLEKSMVKICNQTGAKLRRWLKITEVLQLGPNHFNFTSSGYQFTLFKLEENIIFTKESKKSIQRLTYVSKYYPQTFLSYYLYDII